MLLTGVQLYKKSDKIVTYTLTKTIGMLYLPLIVIFSCCIYLFIFLLADLSH